MYTQQKNWGGGEVMWRNILVRYVAKKFLGELQNTVNKFVWIDGICLSNMSL